MRRHCDTVLAKEAYVEISYLKHEFSGFPLLGICPKELKAGTQTDTCIPTFIAALFTIAKGWKHPSFHQKMSRATKHGVYVQ